MNSNDKITSVIRRMLDEAGLSYEMENDVQIFSLDWALHSPISNVRLYINATPTGFMLLSVPMIKANVNDHALMLELAALMARINYSMRLFKFSLNFDDGALRCSFDFPVEDGFELQPSHIVKYITFLRSVWQRHAASLLGVMLGGKTAEEAYNGGAN